MLKAKSVNNLSKYRLGDETFRNWEEVRVRTKQILSKGVRKLRGKHLKFVLDLLSYHPFYKEKTKDGIKGIKVDVPAFGYGLCFVLIDKKGNEQDFSHKKCTPTATRDREKAIKSMQQQTRLKCYRGAIQSQITDFDTSSNDVRCAICKRKFEDIKANNGIHVDHKTKSFVTLVSEFEAIYKPRQYPSPKRVKTIQGVEFNHDTPEDLEFVTKWQEYHKNNADFQLVCVGCNLKKQDGSRYKPFVND